MGVQGLLSRLGCQSQLRHRVQSQPGSPSRVRPLHLSPPGQPHPLRQVQPTTALRHAVATSCIMLVRNKFVICHSDHLSATFVSNICQQHLSAKFCHAPAVCCKGYTLHFRSVMQCHINSINSLLARLMSLGDTS